MCVCLVLFPRAVRNRESLSSLFEARRICYHQRYQNRHANLHGQSAANGADRIVNAVAGYKRHPQSLVVVDFGTATTLDCVNVKGEYLGGSISPGLQISLDALFVKTANAKVEVERTDSVIGKNTIHSMQAGMFWGYVGRSMSLRIDANKSSER